MPSPIFSLEFLFLQNQRSATKKLQKINLAKMMAQQNMSVYVITADQLYLILFVDKMQI